jgi:hypothetical protein
MPKGKSPDTPKKRAEEPPLSETTEAPAPLVLSAAEQDLLGRALKFLVNIKAQPYATRARREGYTPAEHREGWRLLKLASGEERPLEHLFVETFSSGVTEGAERIRLLQEVDDFENKWFPRTHFIIRRVVPRDRRAAFEAAFFKNLDQQPLGPGVIVSVGTFLSRLDGLSQSNDADAKKVRETLVARGLTKEKIKHVREQLEQLEVGSRAEKPVQVSAAELKRAHDAQREGIEGLRDWFNDWATTLRQVFNTRDQIKLGLTVVKRSAGRDDEDEAVEEDAEEEASEAEDVDVEEEEVTDEEGEDEDPEEG